MNIGLVTPLWVGMGYDSGIAKNYHRLASALAARGHNVTVYFINRAGPCWKPSNRRVESGFTVVEIPCRVLPNSRRFRGHTLTSLAVASIRLCWIVWRRSPPLEVIEATSYGGDAWLYCRLRWRRKPPILVRFSTTSGQISDIPGSQNARGCAEWLENSLIRSARHLCTHTKAHREKICVLHTIDPRRVLVIPHGVTLPDLNQANAHPAADRMVLYVGRFEPRKGTDCLLAAIPTVLARLPDCRFVLAGGGESAGRSREEFCRRNAPCSERVRFLGQVTEGVLDALYQRCDFFVSPAFYESFGMTYLEAMRYGRPVIGCHGSGSAEVIGDAGLVVPPGDSEALAHAIIRLWTDRELHRELSVRARLRAEWFSMERKVEMTELAYKELITTP